MLENVVYSNQFKKDYKLSVKRNLDTGILTAVITSLINEEGLDARFRDHPLRDPKRYKDARECHLLPDWLLVYQVNKETSTLILMRTGTHSDLF